MNHSEQMIRLLETLEVRGRLATLYGNDPETVTKQQERYAALIGQAEVVHGHVGDGISVV